MRRMSMLGSALAVLAVSIAVPVPATFAGEKSYSEQGPGHKKSSYYRGPRVKGYVQRRGGYSYSKADTINTYGDSRSKDGSAGNVRDPGLDRQTSAGPFDHGFFFDSGIAPRGGDSPYMN